MTQHLFSLTLPRWILLTVCLCLTALSACAKVNTASVNIHGVNYTEAEFSYRLQDPTNKDNHGGGELVDSFSAGGTLCCYELPRKWRAGILVEIHTIRYINPTTNDPRVPIEEIREKHVVEVPPYIDGKPGELWVVRNADGTFGLVSSDYQPDHAKWPGKVKGWPVPTVEYRRKLFDVHIKQAESSVALFQKSLSDLAANPEKKAAESWEDEKKMIEENKSAVKYDFHPMAKVVRKLIDLHARFSGPTDPGYIEWLRAEETKWLREKEANLQKLKEARP